MFLCMFFSLVMMLVPSHQNAESFADEQNIPIIEDACQAHGAKYKGKKVGSLGDVGCFSFYPTKNMTVGGDGGMTTTDNEETALKIKSIVRDSSFFKYIINKQKQTKYKFIFFFLIGAYSTYDKGINPNKKKFVSLIKSVADYCKVGLKASYFAIHDSAILKKEKLRMEAIINTDLNNEASN